MTLFPHIDWQPVRKSRLHRLCELAGGFAAAMLITVSPFVIFAEVLW